MTHRGESVNEHGTSISLHTCDACGNDFTVTPAVQAEKLDEWDVCLSEDCPSYEPTRDADLYFGLGMIEKGER